MTAAQLKRLRSDLHAAAMLLAAGLPAHAAENVDAARRAVDDEHVRRQVRGARDPSRGAR